MSAPWRNGRPRVGGSPYDTSELRDVLAQMQREDELAHGDVAHHPAVKQALAEQGATTLALEQGKSGFFDRLVEEYFTHGSIPVRLKDISKAMFGNVTEERTSTWGDSTTQLSFNTTGAEVAGSTTQLALKVNRQRPTTFSILTTITLTGSGWNLEGVTTFTVNYTIGIGLTQTTVSHLLTPASVGVGTQLVDTLQAPLQSLVASVSMAASNNNANQPHNVLVVMLAAPLVQ